jgi:hypothetical protein
MRILSRAACLGGALALVITQNALGYTYGVYNGHYGVQPNRWTCVPNQCPDVAELHHREHRL